MIIFDNFEHDSNASIIKRYPLSTQAITGDTLGFLDLYSFAQGQYIDFGETLQPIPTSIDMVIDLTITPVTTANAGNNNWFGVTIYSNLCVFNPVNTTIGSQENAYWKGSTAPQRVTLHLVIKQIHGHWLVTKKINNDLIFRDKLLVGESVSTPDLSKIRSIATDANLRNIQVHKFVVAYDQEGIIDPTTFNIRSATGTPVGTNISYTGDSLGESINKDSFTETEPRAYTDQFWAKIEIGEEGATNPIRFRGAGNGTVPCFFSIGNSTPQYIEDQQAIPTYFGKGKSTLTVEVARPMVLRFAPGTGAVSISRSSSGYNFQTQASERPPNYIYYNPETGASSTSSSSASSTITNVIGEDGGIVHIYPTGSYSALTDRLTLTDRDNRLLEIIDYGTVCRFFDNGNASTNLTKLPNYLPMVINSLTNAIRYTVITSSEDIQHWDTSRVTDFGSCFRNSSLDFIPNWDYSSATDLSNLIYLANCNEEQTLVIDAPNATNLAGLAQRANLPNTTLVINAPKATTMLRMFEGDNTNIESLTFRNTEFLYLTDVAGFAQNNPNFNFDLSNWCVPFATTTTNFDSGATAWLPENKPNWGNVSCLRRE